MFNPNSVCLCCFYRWPRFLFSLSLLGLFGFLGILVTISKLLKLEIEVYALKSSWSASLDASARIVLTSKGVKDVPPPRGKSISLGISCETGAAVASCDDETLDFLCFWVEPDSSRERFWAAMTVLQKK